MTIYSPEKLERLVSSQPRVNLIARPTPLYPLKNLAVELQLKEILIKRDDLTGLALGGNKSRKLEFIIAESIRQGADTIITWGGLQSNWCLQTAAAARKFGLRPVLVLFKTYDLPVMDQGNILLEKMLGAEIQVKETLIKGKSASQEEAFPLLDKVAEEERKNGHQPFLVSVGGSACGGHLQKPLGALAYLSSLLEIYHQTAASAIPDYLVVASGSGGTQAGLLVGAKALGLKTRIIGICVSDKKEEFLPVVRSIALDLVKFLNLDLALEDDDIILFDDYLGAGYGQVTPEVSAVIRLLLKKEALVLDPVYTSKAMLGLIDLARKKYFQPGDRVLFLHTGGVPALFAFSDRLLAGAS